MGEILISDFNTTRVPSDFTLGDGSWNTDHDLSGSDLKIGTNSAGGAGATTLGGCRATFAPLDLSSIISAGSQGFLVFRFYDSTLISGVKVTLSDANAGEIAWTAFPWILGNPRSISYHFITALAGLDRDLNNPSMMYKPDGLYGCRCRPLVETIDWTQVVSFKIEGLGGFSPQPFALGFTLLKAYKE